MIVLVYQMGKVGSSTVTDSLVSSGFQRCELYYSSVGGPLDPMARYVIHAHGTNSVKRFLASCCAAGMADQITIITLVRDLLSRNISAFFENCAKPHKQGTWFFGSEDEVLAAPLDSLARFFRERNARHLEEVVKTWPMRFQDATGMPLLDLPFDAGRGSSLYRRPDGMRLLTFQTERLSDNWTLLQDAVGLPTLAMIRANQGSEKWYADTYRAFKKNYRPSGDELVAHYNNDLMRHFYSADDLSKFRAQWPLTTVQEPAV